ncbi:tissue factor pathway inhibitor isoform X2 [Ambystoma mexicanum]
MKSGRWSWCLLPWLLAQISCDLTHGEEEEEEAAAAAQIFYPDPDLAPLKLGHSFCGLKQDTGPCKARFERFSFNVHSRQCEPFEYGGCDGNENNFETLQDCQEKCIVKDTPPKKRRGKLKQEKKPEFCFLEDDPGICRGLITRYFYNKHSAKCEMFKYGGCLGNANNFWTLEDCQLMCEDQLTSISNAQQEISEQLNIGTPIEMPMPSARISVSNVQEEISGKLNLTHEMPITSARSTDFRGPSACLKPLDSGNCAAKERRFYYHNYVRKCLPFLYSGCGGNENNFTSRKSCLKLCKKDSVKIRRKKKKESLKATSDKIIVELS